jgi:hypothetical protein
MIAQALSQSSFMFITAISSSSVVWFSGDINRAVFTPNRGRPADDTNPPPGWAAGLFRLWITFSAQVS